MKPSCLSEFPSGDYEAPSYVCQIDDFFVNQKENIFSANVDLVEPHLLHPPSSIVEVPKPRKILPKIDSDSQELYNLSIDSSSSSIMTSSPASERKIRINRKRKNKRITNLIHVKSTFKVTGGKRARQFHSYRPSNDSQQSDLEDGEQTIVEKQARFDGDMYTARFQRGTGDNKEGLCPICEPSTWLKIKQSAYWYHMNYHHGISATTGKPYDPPTDYHVEKIGRDEVDESILQLKGYCSRCEDWVVIMTKYLDECDRNHTGSLDDLISIDQVNFMSWYRHCQRCGPKKSNKKN